MKCSFGEVQFATVLYEPAASALARAFGVPAGLGLSNGVTLCTIRNAGSDATLIGLARCARTDEFSLERGRKLAFTRAISVLDRATRKTLWQEILPKLGVPRA